MVEIYVHNAASRSLEDSIIPFFSRLFTLSLFTVHKLENGVNLWKPAQRLDGLHSVICLKQNHPCIDVRIPKCWVQHLIFEHIM